MFNDLFCYFVDFNINFIISFSSFAFFIYSDERKWKLYTAQSLPQRYGQKRSISLLRN